MAYIPQVIGNFDLSAETLTAIGEDIGVGVTVVADSLETLHAYGNVVTTNTSMCNKWCNALVNKILRSKLIDTMYKSRLAATFKGVLDIGEGIEEILVPPAAVQQENQNPASPRNPYGAPVPDVKTAWHVTNAEMVYGVKVKRIQLRRAFASFASLDSFVQRIVDSLYNADEWDSQLLTKYKIAQMILARIAASKTVAVASPVTSDGTAFLAGCRTYAELFKWMSNEYNDAAVATRTGDDKIHIIMPAEVEAHVDVKDLAAAFNLEYAQFIGRRMPVDRFTFTDAEKARIMALSGLESWTFTEAQETSLEGVLGVICDIDLIQFYDTFEPELWENPNGADAELNYWLHAAKVCGISPFANAVVFVAGSDETEGLDVQP